MAKMVVTHDVLDVDNWLKGKAERANAISAMGCSNVVDYVAQDGSKAIAVTADAEDPAGSRSRDDLPTRRGRGRYGSARSRATDDGLHREVARRRGTSGCGQPSEGPNRTRSCACRPRLGDVRETSPLR